MNFLIGMGQKTFTRAGTTELGSETVDPSSKGGWPAGLDTFLGIVSGCLGDNRLCPQGPIHLLFLSQNASVVAGEMAQQSKTLATRPEDPS